MTEFLVRNVHHKYPWFLFVRNVGGTTLGLPGDPWLAPPGLLSALPGFLAAPHTGYPSYLTSPRRLPSPPNVAAVANAVPGTSNLSRHTCYRVRANSSASDFDWNGFNWEIPPFIFSLDKSNPKNTVRTNKVTSFDVKDWSFERNDIRKLFIISQL